MIKEMKGWKVITEHGRRSARASYWMSTTNWSVDYPVNVEVFPNIKGSKLFFFETKKAACDFVIDEEIVVPCIAKNATKVKAIGENSWDIMTFWKNKKAKKKLIGVMVPPNGTYMAESITCLE